MGDTRSEIEGARPPSRPFWEGRTAESCSDHLVSGQVVWVGVSCIWHLGSCAGEIRQDNCLRTGNSCAIVPLPLPIGRGVFFVMSEKRESKCCWRSSTVEQLICNQQVAGSIPIASSNGEFCAEAGVAEWLKAADCKSAGILPTVVRTHPPAPLSCVGERESRE